MEKLAQLFSTTTVSPVSISSTLDTDDIIILVEISIHILNQLIKIREFSFI